MRSGRGLRRTEAIVYRFLPFLLYLPTVLAVSSSSDTGGVRGDTGAFNKCKSRLWLRCRSDGFACCYCCTQPLMHKSHASFAGSPGHQQRLRNLSPRARAAWDQFSSASYGRWCGANTGGHVNCCSGVPCPACNESAITDDQLLPAAACLAACPPEDGLDRACAIHDTCLKKPVVKRNRPSSGQSCSPLSNNFCGCDGQLVRNVEACACRIVCCLTRTPFAE